MEDSPQGVKRPDFELDDILGVDEFASNVDLGSPFMVGEGLAGGAEEDLESVNKRAKTEPSEGGEADDEDAWLFDCICGLRVPSSAPEDKHPVGDMFACESCNVWSHLNCYVEFKDLSNDDVSAASIFCRKCRPSDNALLNVSTATVTLILSHLDFQTRRHFMQMSKAFCSLAREAESSLKIAHSSPDVVIHLLQTYTSLRCITLFCWHTKFGRLMPHLRELTIVSAAPAATLGGISRDLEILHVHDSAVTDIGVKNALGRGGRNLILLRELSLTGTSVTGNFPHLIPDSLSTLVLCSTPTNDEGLFGAGICSLDGNGTQFPNLRKLDLSHTLVTSSILKNLPRKLVELNLSFCPDITVEGLISWLSGSTRLSLEKLILLQVVREEADIAKLKQLAPKTLVICSPPKAAEKK